MTGTKRPSTKLSILLPDELPTLVRYRADRCVQGLFIYLFCIHIMHNYIFILALTRPNSLRVKASLGPRLGLINNKRSLNAVWIRILELCSGLK